MQKNFVNKGRNVIRKNKRYILTFVSKQIDMKNILFANDFSDTSEMALKYTVECSIKLKAKLTLVHIHDISALLANPTEIPYFPSTNGEYLEAQKKKMQEQLLFVAADRAKQIDTHFDAIEHTSVSLAITEKRKNSKRICSLWFLVKRSFQVVEIRISKK